MLLLAATQHIRSNMRKAIHLMKYFPKEQALTEPNIALIELEFGG